ncbi:MAG TPA: ABC transporter permease [Puia sp.]|nr:ABC transporter permease [Puia sp.]
MSSTVTAHSTTLAPAARPIIDLPGTSTVFSALLRADLTTQWRNRRATILVILIPAVILISWKGLVPRIGAANVLANCITVGLNAIGLMGYTNSIARDRDKGIFQRLRITPAPRWTIMVSRLTVQLMMIAIVTLILFIVGFQSDHITMTAKGYVLAFLASIVGGAIYLSLGQVIVGLIRNAETVNVVTRLVYFIFIMVGMFASIGLLGKKLGDISLWSPYGTVQHILADALNPNTWNTQSSMALLVTIGYTIVFTFLGIRWFRWQSSK